MCLLSIAVDDDDDNDAVCDNDDIDNYSVCNNYDDNETVCDNYDDDNDVVCDNDDDDNDVVCDNYDDDNDAACDNDDDNDDNDAVFQIGAGLSAVGRPVQKRSEEDGQIGTNQSQPLERGALFNRFFGKPAHGPPHVTGGASGPIGGCRDESRTYNPDLDLRHVFHRNNRKTDLI